MIFIYWILIIALGALLIHRISFLKKVNTKIKEIENLLKTYKDQEKILENKTSNENITQ